MSKIFKPTTGEPQARRAPSNASSESTANGLTRQESRSDLPVLSHQAMVVDRLTLNDVVLGRGVAIAKYECNVRFRGLIQTRKDDYNGTSRHGHKRLIANEILQEIGFRGGKFLRQMESIDTSPAWFTVNESVALTKIKQTLREMTREKGHKPMAPRACQVATVPSPCVRPCPVESSSVMRTPNRCDDGKDIKDINPTATTTSRHSESSCSCSQDASSPFQTQH